MKQKQKKTKETKGQPLCFPRIRRTRCRADERSVIRRMKIPYGGRRDAFPPYLAGFRFFHRTLLNRSAIRVCQPAPVAFQRSITSTGNRREINLRGFGEMGLPPLFTFARASISSVSSGRALYSSFFKVCASTHAMSDFKAWGDAFLFAFIGFLHAENVAIRATRCIAYNDPPPFK